MALLDNLAQPEADQLWWRIIRGLSATCDELDSLTLCPAYARDLLYGPGVYEAHKGVRDDLADLLDHDLGITLPLIEKLISDPEDQVITSHRDGGSLEIWSQRVHRWMARRG